MNFSAEQFSQLLATLSGGNANQAASAPRNDPAALGPIRQCILGTDKMKKLNILNEWLEDAENRMSYIGITNDKEKIILLKTWGGPEIVELIRLVNSHLNTRVQDQEHNEQEETYKDLIDKLRLYLSKMVNRTMAMHQLLSTQQGSRSWSDFIRDLEKKAKTLNFEKKPYTTEEAIKDAAIFGMNDTSLREKALAEDPDLEKLSRWGQAKETGKEDARNLNKDTIRRIKPESPNEHMSVEEIDDMMQTLQVMKLKKAGRYSSRNRKQHCNRCNSDHQPERCPANGKTCFACQGKNHFAKTPACPKTIKRVSTERKDSQAQEKETLTTATKGSATINKVSTTTPNKWVDVRIGGINQRLYADTGSEFTIITPEHYTPMMGELEESDLNFRPWGGNNLLDVKGMVNTTIHNSKGARVNSKVYVIDGFQPEPLLGDTDAEKLGIITFNKEGRAPTGASIKRIPNMLRKSLEVEVETHPPFTDADPQEQAKTQTLVEKYRDLVFDDNKVGCLKIEPIHLEYDKDFKPKQQPFRNIPFHYQEDVSNLLDFLRKQGVITDVDPRNSYDCVMNVVITDKKNGQIRMNIDNTPRNPGMQRTKFHVQTPQEIRHELKEATVFSEMDMGWGFHQLPLDEATKEKSIFQTHEGLHRMERLYFGPTASSGIFHNEVRKCFAGLKGVATLHDNILVYGKDYEDHYHNLKQALERCAETGIILKLSKSNFCLTRVKWFGRDFHSNGVTADPDKIRKIQEGGRPNNTEDVRSLLMACQYNAKFTFDNSLNLSYEEVTAPLRQLLKKGQKFTWGTEQEQAYQQLMTILNDPATLQSYDPHRKTHIITDTSEVGTQCSIYQETKQDTGAMTWVPIDHVSRALTEQERDYSPIERESLGLQWGLE